MHEEIASDAALSFSPEAVHLQRRIGNEWQEADHVRFDGGDVGGGLARIRDTLRDEAGMPAVLLVIPDDQLLYTRLKVAADAPALMSAAVAEALDGLTPYALSDLAFDWLPAAPGEVHVAAVSRQTLIEAADFAIRHGFAIRGFIADPDPERFPGEPGFSLAAAGQDADDEAEFLPRIDRHRLQASIERLRALAVAQESPDADGVLVAADSAEEDAGAPVVADGAAVAVAAADEVAADRVWITPIPPSIPYPVGKIEPSPVGAGKPSNESQNMAAEDRPAVRVARLGGQSRETGVDGVADGQVARSSDEAAPIVRHGASPAPEVPALPWLRQHLSARHGPLAAMIALLVVMMVAVAFLAGGRPDADAPPALADAVDAPAVTPATEPSPADAGKQQAALATDGAEADDVAPSVSASPADMVQAAADDALGRALRDALGPETEATPAIEQAEREPSADQPAVARPEGEVVGQVEARATQADDPDTAPADPPRIAGGEAAMMPEPALPPTPETAPVPAGQPEARLAMAETQPAPPAQPEPELEPAAHISPVIVTQPVSASADTAPVAEPANRATVPGSARPAVRPERPAATMRAHEPTARSAPTEAATGTDRQAAPAQALRPAPRPQMARNAGPGAAPAATPAPVAATPSSRPRAAPEGTGAGAIPVATPRLGLGLDQSIRPPVRPRRSGAVQGLSPGADTRHLASQWAPPGSDPAAFLIPLRLAQVERLPADPAARFAQARPQPRPGAATAIDAALQEATTAPPRPASAGSASAGAASHGGRPVRKPGAAASTAAVESAIASAIRGSTVPSAPDPSVVPGALRASALPPRRSGDAMRATAAGIVAADPPASQPSTAATAAAAQATQDAAAAQRRRMEDELQAQAEARIRARADADSQVEARARAQAEARARAQAEAEERAARARGGQYRPAELDDEPELAALTGGTDSQIVAQNATVARGLDTNRTTLIGVVGAGKASRGLIRLRNGRIVTVRVGDRIDGGPITAIGDGVVTYTVGGRARQLKILDGR